MIIPIIPIKQIVWKDKIMTVSFHNGLILKFIDIPEWQYAQFLSSNDQFKFLKDLALHKPFTEVQDNFQESK